MKFLAIAAGILEAYKITNSGRVKKFALGVIFIV